MCVGFWVSVGLWALFAGMHVMDVAVVSFIGSALYELKEKFLPCEACTFKSDTTWTVK